MGYNRTYRGASGTNLAASLCASPPPPGPGPEEVGNDATPHVGQPRGGRDQAPL